MCQATRHEHTQTASTLLCTQGHLQLEGGRSAAVPVVCLETDLAVTGRDCTTVAHAPASLHVPPWGLFAEAAPAYKGKRMVVLAAGSRDARVRGKDGRGGGRRDKKNSVGGHC